MVKKKGSTQEITIEDRPIATEDTSGKIDLRSSLAEIKKNSGVLGYILKDKTRAVVDLNEPSKISDYAFFSSAASEAANEFADIFSLGEVKRTIVEGKTVKMLVFEIGDSRVTVFMEKNVDANKIYEKI